MIIDCDACVVNSGSGERTRYSRAKVGVGSSSSGKPVLIVITNQTKDKFNIVDNCCVRSTTISFKSPKKDLYIKNCDQTLIKALIALISKISRHETIPKLAAISSLEKLKPKPTSLSIKDNNFSDSDLSNKCLTKLFVQNFKLIPRLVWKLNNLFELKLISCDLDEIPYQLTQLGPKLRILDLSHNSIESIDGSFISTVKLLNHLNLSHNKLVYIPFEIKFLKGLEHIDFSHNKLSHLPYSLCHIISLKVLNINNNLFQSLPFSVFKVMYDTIRLQNFDVSDNPFREPLSDEKTSLQSIKCFPSLQYLSFSAILKHDSVLSRTHQNLPPVLYKTIQMNGELCSVCLTPIVDRSLKLKVINQSFEGLATCMSSSYFPTFPLFPVIKYICILCLLTRKYI